MTSTYTPHKSEKYAQNAPACLYFGKVMHARMKPKAHRFNYRVFSLLIDLDRLEEASRGSFFFSVNKSNLVSFNERDHGRRDGSSLRKHIDALLEKGGIEKPDRIMLWCNPRVLGYTFNPLSIYYCYNANDDVIALVYQVHNTFGESHAYVAHVDPEAKMLPSIRQSAAKQFYVSPFLEMDLRYDFRICPPAERMKIRILEHDKDGPILSATFSGYQQPLKTMKLLLGISQTLGLSLKIIAGIHFEALLLWLKGIKIYPRPSPPGKATYVPNRKKMVPGE
ncbi:MAG: DUF1365 domain-containing protein [Pseudomonadota bacterium]